MLTPGFKLWLSAGSELMLYICFFMSRFFHIRGGFDHDRHSIRKILTSQAVECTNLCYLVTKGSNS